MGCFVGVRFRSFLSVFTSKSVCGRWFFRTFERLIVVLHKNEFLRDLYLLEVFVDEIERHEI